MKPLRTTAALIVAATLAGCGSEPAPRGPATINVREGTYRGVGIGSTRDEARRELGRSTARATDPLAPIAADPLEIGIPPAPQDPPNAKIAVWRYEHVAMAAGRGRAWLVTIAADDAITEAGVGVGSRLEDARAAYPKAECGTANEGTEYTQFEYCTVRVAPNRHLWFGHDPIRSVTLSRMPLQSPV